MNISTAARQALMPIERKIKSEPIENLYILNNRGNIIQTETGSKHTVNFELAQKSSCKDRFILTHNHPSSSPLSPKDIKSGIEDNFCEVRATTKDGLCHLVEIPNLSEQQKAKCFGFLEVYQDLAKTLGLNINTVRAAQKKLEEYGGLKFRTIKLPE